MSKQCDTCGKPLGEPSPDNQVAVISSGQDYPVERHHVYCLLQSAAKALADAVSLNWGAGRGKR